MCTPQVCVGGRSRIIRWGAGWRGTLLRSSVSRRLLPRPAQAREAHYLGARVRSSVCTVLLFAGAHHGACQRDSLTRRRRRAARRQSDPPAAAAALRCRAKAPPVSRCRRSASTPLACSISTRLFSAVCTVRSAHHDGGWRCCDSPMMARPQVASVRNKPSRTPGPELRPRTQGSCVARPPLKRTTRLSNAVVGMEPGPLTAPEQHCAIRPRDASARSRFGLPAWRMAIRDWKKQRPRTRLANHRRSAAPHTVAVRLPPTTQPAALTRADRRQAREVRTRAARPGSPGEDWPVPARGIQRDGHACRHADRSAGHP